MIIDSKDIMEIHALDKKIKNFDKDMWSKQQYRCALQGNYYKFAQDSHLRQALLSTGDKAIVYANPNDRTWGIGSSIEEANINNPFKWKGDNLLGYALMEVRDEIRRVFKNYEEEGKIQMVDKTDKYYKVNDLMVKMDKWHEAGEYHKIIFAILNYLPEEEYTDEIMGYLAVAYNNTGQYKKAVETLEKLRPSQEDTSMWQYRLGYALYYSREYTKAREAFNKALLLEPRKDIEEDCHLFLSWIEDVEEERVTYYDDELGEFRLYGKTGLYAATINWCDNESTLNIYTEDKSELKKFINQYKKSFLNHTEWDAKVKAYACDELLTLKNNVWLDEEEGEVKLTELEFKERMSLDILELHDDNRYTLWYDDGDMFFGHVIVIEGDFENGFTSVQIEG
ncbi:MAG: NADAR domain-containing protein [Anaeromicrobium sp.]|uniref:NADAR domain-containing protein n=1 Tax=Anaeromicrobium sp. TaxID=1929132 RepID=UPI0025F040B3|nr:NADAR domain-containing protein [Anaeromicrobium sp.]MCT4595465.1 NADAR domain-containing protein [Anaeromicrobium sp.]